MLNLNLGTDIFLGGEDSPDKRDCQIILPTDTVLYLRELAQSLPFVHAIETGAIILHLDGKQKTIAITEIQNGRRHAKLATLLKVPLASLTFWHITRDQHEQLKSAIYGDSGHDSEARRSREIANWADFASQMSADGDIDLFSAAQPAPSTVDDGVDAGQLKHVRDWARRILAIAYEEEASDVFIRNGANVGFIRFRCDSAVEHRFDGIPSSALRQLLNVFANMANVQVHQLHLYGKNAVIPFRVRLPSGEFVATKYRCCFVPTIRGTNLSIRQNAEPIRDLEKIGFEPEQLGDIRKALNHTHGLILVTGPTGSGKSNTRESMLTILEQRPIEIYEWGDPIEFESDKRLQISITDDFKWHDALSFALRSNPDVITPSEFRDEHQSRYIIDAALTGHLVVTTVHTTDIPSTFTRLLRFAIPASCLADTVTAVICQRLVKVLCPECKIPDDQARRRGLTHAFKAPRETHCRYCASKGYRGQSAIGEVLYITPRLTALIHQLSLGSNGVERDSVVTGTQIVEAARQEAAEAGCMWITMQEAANRKVAAGITSQSEIDRVLTLIPESPTPQVYHWNPRANLATARPYSARSGSAEYTVQIEAGDIHDVFS